MVTDIIKLFNINTNYTEDELKKAYQLKIIKIENMDLDVIDKQFFIECLGKAFTDGLKNLWAIVPKMDDNHTNEYH